MFQRAEDVGMAFYLYVENESEQLVGVCLTQSIINTSTIYTAQDFMITEVITVQPEATQGCCQIGKSL